jgi:hypothetical protein
MSKSFKAPESVRRQHLPTDPARRSVLRTLASLTGSVALLNFVALRSAAAQKKKKTLAEVNYQPTPKGKQNCANCDLFIKPDQCKSVEGTVAPEGWCKIWVAY